jgi:hypothetical protein
MKRDTRTIVLDGREFPVGQLCWEQLRVVMPIAQRLDEKVTDAVKNGILKLSTEDYDDMIGAIFEGLRIDNPDLTIDQLKKMRSSPQEMFLAFLVVRYQTGAWVAPEDAEGTPGEAQGSPTLPA